MHARKDTNITSETDDYLARLTSAHDELKRQIFHFEGITAGAVPDRITFEKARWTIGRASLSRRMLWREIYNVYMPQLDESKREALRALQRTEEALVSASNKHINEWSTDRALSKWDRYCSASREIRWKMKAALHGESRVLRSILF